VFYRGKIGYVKIKNRTLTLLGQIPNKLRLEIEKHFLSGGSLETLDCRVAYEAHQEKYYSKCLGRNITYVWVLLPWGRLQIDWFGVDIPFREFLEIQEIVLKQTWSK